jgi:hypothetical protein
MTPTPKVKPIENLMESIVGITRQEAARQNICTFCKQPVGEFDDPVSRIEYTISGFCQKCQDKVFG